MFKNIDANGNFITKTNLNNFEKNKKNLFYRPNGLHWITAGFFIVADMAGGGVVAMPLAFLESGFLIGSILTAIVTIAFCYTAHILGQNWLLMCEKWPNIYGGYILSDKKEFVHCRKPYPEMAYRSMGKKAQLLTSIILNIMLYGISIVYLLLSTKIISDFVLSIFKLDIGQCSMLLYVSLSLLPITFLKSPQDFWWAVVTAMITTAFAVILILLGTAFDAPQCVKNAQYPETLKFDNFLLSVGIFMFAYGGHGVFPTIQHDMKRPQQFTKSSILAFTIVFFMYVPVSILAYYVYGISLQESVISSIQELKFRVAANLCIAVHCILTLTIVINPLNQQFEHLLHIPQQFGWKRCLVRSGVMAFIVFSAETFPSFNPILNLIGGTGVALTSAIMPCLFYLYLNARYGKNVKTIVNKTTLTKPSINIIESNVPTFKEVIQNNSTLSLIINFSIIGIAIILGALTTKTALIEIATSNFSKPCYISNLS